MTVPAESYLIVGTGIFGASTALHLKTALPDSTITLIDRSDGPCASAASHDLNKIVRADYDDIFYMKLAIESMEAWRSSKTFSPYYHESGILIADDIGWGRNALLNYQALGVETEAETLTLEEAVLRFPILKQAKWDGANSCYWNPASGWAEANEALHSCYNAAKAVGVRFCKAQVLQVLTDDQRRCIGVSTADGNKLFADNIVLCTGAYTEKLFLDSFPSSPELHVNGRLVAAGAISCSATFNRKDDVKVQGLPVVINTLPHTHGESVPPLWDGRLKFNCELSFTNMTSHTATGKRISIPPARETQSTWSQDAPPLLKQEATRIMRNTYGDCLQGLEVDEFRICWDAVTPDQNWIISPHPEIAGLFIATGGSFHSWKFMPTIGKYVTKMLLGDLSEDMARRWAWDRLHDGVACPMYIPTRDLGELYESNGATNGVHDH